MSKLPIDLKRHGSQLLKTLSLIPSELGLNPLMQPRRLNACCCGLSKTGTHSMAGIFGNFRSRHHPDAALRLGLSVRHLKGDLNASAAERILAERDRKLWLEMESSTLAGILIEPLVKACPEKKFILTLRDVFSWCNSWIDQNITLPPPPGSGFNELDRLRLRGESFPPTKYDAPLIAHGFPSLASFFQLWASHNMLVLSSVPSERLFAVKTTEIGEQMADIARWVGIEPRLLRADQSWLAAAPRRYDVLGMLDACYVRDTAAQFCKPLMDKHFPEMSDGAS